MFRMSNLAVLVALAAGAAGGWAAASGRFDSLLKAEPKTAAAESCPLAGGDCCKSPDQAAVLAAVNAHNQKVSATLQKDGKKPNILYIMGDDIGWFQVGAYHRGIMSGLTPNLDKLASQGMVLT